MEEMLIYSSTLLLCMGIVYYYIRRHAKQSLVVQAKVAQAKEEGRFEPVSLYPYVDPNICLGSGACIRACPEEDILGLSNGQATIVNASSCIGHGACFHSCPVDAISLRIGTEQRGVDLPHIQADYQTNIPGIYIAGELGGMGLIKNSAEQGMQAIENLANQIPRDHGLANDLIIVGAGPAGIAAALKAKQLGLSFRILEQESLGGTVFTFPRDKVVMTQPVELPFYGKLKLFNTSKEELLKVWLDLLRDNSIKVEEHCKVEGIQSLNPYHFKVETSQKGAIESAAVLLAIGRRGTPRKLGIPGEESTKVAYRLLDSEQIEGQKIMVVGGGDSAVESALLLMDRNEVILSYRKEHFARIKRQNQIKLEQAIAEGKIEAKLSTNLKAINPETVLLQNAEEKEELIQNDKVYIFIGGELPLPFLQQCGISIEKTFGKVVKQHK